jgi:hypothetical protein
LEERLPRAGPHIPPFLSFLLLITNNRPLWLYSAAFRPSLSLSLLTYTTSDNTHTHPKIHTFIQAKNNALPGKKKRRGEELKKNKKENGEEKPNKENNNNNRIES